MSFKKNARIKLIAYAESYRKEVTLLANERLEVENRVRISKPFNVTSARRNGPLASIYQSPEYIITAISHDIVEVRNIITNRITRKHKTICKKIIE